MAERPVVDLKALYGEQAKLGELPAYLERTLIFTSPVTSEVVIFDHDPF